MVIIAGAMMLGCSQESVQMTPPDAQKQKVEISWEQQEAEDAVYAELLQELDALNAYYTQSDPSTPQLYGIWLPRWLRKVLNVVCADALGRLVCSSTGPVGATIGAIISSVSAGACLDTEGRLRVSETVWPATLNIYLTSIMNEDVNDQAGEIHNEVIIKLLKKYGKSGLQSMSENELYNAVIKEYVNAGNSLPPNYGSPYYYSQIMSGSKQVVGKSDYNQTLEMLTLTKPGLKNQCTVLKSYLGTMENISEEQCLQYHLDFRNTVINSSIPSTAKANIRLCISVGLGSANLWKAVE